MTSKEIMQAGFLDILFEFRNKEYGAYALRSDYNKRISKALGIALGSTLFLLFLFMNTVGTVRVNAPGTEPEVIIKTVSIDPPVPPAIPVTNAHRKARSIKSTSISIVSEVLHPEVPQVDDLWTDAAISAVSNAGSQVPPGLPPVEQLATVPPVPAEAVAEAISSAPEFPGGSAAWLAFLGRQLQSPEELEAGEARTVLVKFVVGIDGSISDLVLVSSGGAQFDNEVIRVLKRMPKWKPAVKNGRPVPTLFTQPVTFRAGE